jgi:hypothetical protein
MSGFASLSEIKTEVNKGHGKIIVPYGKLGQTMVAGRMENSWSLAGLPAAGTNPTAGMAGAVTCSKTTTGAPYFPDAPAGQDNFLWKVSTTRAGSTISTPGLCYVFDRLAHANVSIVQATASFSPIIDGTARLATGEGAQILCIVTTALSAASNVFTLTYTNEAGTAGRTTQQVTTVASAIVGSSPYANYTWVPLQAGDKGVRSIEGWTLVSGTATGNINIILANPLSCWSHNFLPNENEVDLSCMLNGMSKVNNSACLDFVSLGGTTSSATVMNNSYLIQK